MVAKDILKVLYAPHKVFKDIVQKPGYVGPFLLLIIFVLAQVGGAYVVASRSYLETSAPQTLPLGPQGDLWTEDAAFWHANEGVTVSNNTVDYINSTYATTSIEFTAADASNVWMEINFNGSVNCGAGGFQNVSFRLKQVNPDVAPENVSLYLYSLGDSNFYYDLTSAFSNSIVNVWNNITLNVGTGSEGWVGSGATWENITGLKLDFTWSNRSNVDLRIDGGGFPPKGSIFCLASVGQAKSLCMSRERSERVANKPCPNGSKASYPLLRVSPIPAPQGSDSLLGFSFDGVFPPYRSIIS